MALYMYLLLICFVLFNPENAHIVTSPLQFNEGIVLFYTTNTSWYEMKLKLKLE
jgi:hypothetical protein